MNGYKSEARAKSNTWYFSLRVIVMLFIISLTTTAWSQIPDTLWSEKWEGDWTINWHIESGTWEVGVPTSGPGKPRQGQKCAATVLNGNYSEPVDTRLIRHTPFVVPRKDKNPRLRFWHWYSFSAGDFGQVQIKVGNGAWKPIPTSYTNTGSGVWTYPSIDLSSYADSTIQISFYFHSEDVFGNGGPDVSSGWYIDDVRLISGPIIFNGLESFESDIGDWAAERGTWEVGAPTACPPDSAHSLSNCAGTVLEGNYSESVDSRLISPSFVVPNASKSPALRFWHWFSFSSGDFGEIQIRVNNGSWQSISNRFTSTSSGVWTLHFISLTPYANSTVQIAFYFHSEDVFGNGGSDVSRGWYVDDVEIVPPSVTPAALYFRNVKVGQTATQSVTVTNTGTGTVNVGPISVQGNNATNFNVNQPAFTLSPGQSQKVEVRFTPHRVRIFDASLRINSDAANVNIRLTGNGVDRTSLKVYVMSGGNAASDQAVLSILSARGISPTLGIQLDKWDGTKANLKDFNAVVLLNNYNWRVPSMPDSGQSALKNYVIAGGGLVTGEWLIASIYSIQKNKGLDPIVPAIYTGHQTPSNTIYTRIDADAILNYGLPSSFSFPLNFIDGTEGILEPKPGAKVYYSSCNTGRSGLIAWNYGKGRVISFSTLISAVELTDPDYATLFVNAVEWAAQYTTSVNFDDAISLPSDYQLEQNYPNPFNPATTIGFSLPRSSHVTLKVFDLLGAEVSTLMDQELTAGRHEVHWDANSVKSGVYFYQLRAGEFVETKRLLLMK